jgi:hypothetical protein
MVMPPSVTIRGRNGLKAFDKAGMQVDAAFWSLSEDDEWRFYLHTLLYDVARQQIYNLLREALINTRETVRVQEISLLPSHSDMLRMMRSTYSFGLVPDFEYEISNVAIGNYYFKHLLIYRL